MTSDADMGLALAATPYWRELTMYSSESAVIAAGTEMNGGMNE